MKVSRKHLDKIIKEATLNEFFGGKKKKEKQAAALDELQKAALEYISKSQSGKVGPFLDKNNDPLNSPLATADGRKLQRGVVEPAYQHRDVTNGPRLDDEAHEEMKQHHEELDRIAKAWEQATGERADNDNSIMDAKAVSKARAMLSMYLRSHGDDVKEGKMIRVTKRQLRKIIKETHPDYQGLPQSDIDYYELADDYAMWVKENGHVTPAASSVMATYFLEKGLKDDHAKHEMLGKAFKVAHNDIMADIRRQETEKTNMMRESTMKITKRQLRRVIKESMASMTVDKRDQLMDALEDKFGLKVRTTEEFGSSPGGIWLSGEDGTTASDGIPLFDSYAEGMGPYDDFGVHAEFNEFIEPYGFFAEWYDPGTLMLWRA